MNEKIKIGEERLISHSQNYLKNTDFVAGLVDKTNINKDDLVIEIGPGKGIITTQLSKKSSNVVAIELDHELATSLSKQFSNTDNVEIVEADFLDRKLPLKPYKIFANIPFNLTADIVNKLLTANNPPEVAYLIMQDRAVGRFAGPPLGPNSQISTLLYPFYKIKIIRNISRNQFDPVPKVGISLASFEKKNKPEIDFDKQQFYRDFVIFGFNQWKPTVSDSFKKIFSRQQLDKIQKEINTDKLKPSELNASQWIKLFNLYLNELDKTKQDLVKGSEKKMKQKQKGMKKQHRTRS